MRAVWKLTRKMDLALSHYGNRRAIFLVDGSHVRISYVGRLYYGRLLLAASVLIMGVVLTWPTS